MNNRIFSVGISAAATAIFLALAMQPRALAQTETEATTVDDVSEDDQRPIDLIVVVGEGYRPRTVQSAARLSVPLENVPINVSVLSGDVIDDLQLSTQRDALRFTSAVDDKAVRGFNTEEFFRNGFIAFSDVPGYTIERIEIVRGPTATLNGPVSPGGGINTITKKAHVGRTFGEMGSYLGFANGDPDTRRNANAYLDFNIGDIGLRNASGDPLAAFRFVGGYDNDTGFDHKLRDISYSILPTLQIRPTENTVIDLEYYQYEVDTDRSDRAFGVELTLPGPTAIEQIPLAVAYGIPARANYNGSDFTNREWLNDFTVSIAQSLLNDQVLVQLKYNQHNRDFLTNPHSGPNINGDFARVLRPGAPAGSIDPADFVISRLITDVDIRNRVDQTNFLVSFTPDAAQNHRFIVGMDWYDQHRWFQQRRPYDFDTDQVFRQIIEIDSVMDPSETFEVDFGGANVAVRDLLERINETTYRTTYLNYLGSFHNERLHVLAGVAQTDVELHETNIMSNFALIPNPQRVLISDTSETLLQAGAIFEIAQGYNIFANYSESQIPTTNQAAVELAPPVRRGEQTEIGVKYSLFDDRISGTIGYFWVDAYIEGIADAITMQPVDRITASEGFDLDLYVQPFDDWITVFSYSHADTEVKASDINSLRVGDPLDREVPHKVAVWSKYQFLQGPLDGLSVGGGYSWRGERPRGIPGALGLQRDPSGDVLRFRPVSRLDMFAKYLLDMRGDYDVELSLNLRNLTREDNISAVTPPIPLQGGVQPDGQPYEFDGEIEIMFGAKLAF